MLKAIVVGDRCKAGGIHGERQCSKSRTINHETAYKVRGEVLRIRRTTTIPEKENFIPISERRDEFSGRPRDIFEQFIPA